MLSSNSYHDHDQILKQAAKSASVFPQTIISTTVPVSVFVVVWCVSNIVFDRIRTGALLSIIDVIVTSRSRIRSTVSLSDSGTDTLEGDQAGWRLQWSDTVNSGDASNTIVV